MLRATHRVHVPRALFCTGCSKHRKGWWFRYCGGVRGPVLQTSYELHLIDGEFITQPRIFDDKGDINVPLSVWTQKVWEAVSSQIPATKLIVPDVVCQRLFAWPGPRVPHPHQGGSPSKTRVKPATHNLQIRWLL